MNHDTVHLFEQLAVILLQRFNVPHALEHYANGKWKDDAGWSLRLVLRRVSDNRRPVVPPLSDGTHLSVDSQTDGKWYNGKPDGEFVDVPTAQSFGMLSAPIPGACAPPPQQLFARHSRIR